MVDSSSDLPIVIIPMGPKVDSQHHLNPWSGMVPPKIKLAKEQLELALASYIPCFEMRPLKIKPQNQPTFHATDGLQTWTPCLIHMKSKALLVMHGKSDWWLTYPSEKWWTSSVGMMTFPTEWKHGSNVPNHQSESPFIIINHYYPLTH